MNAFHKLLRTAAVLLAGVAILNGCGGGGGGGGSSGTTGTLKLALTDAPACGYENVFITVEKVRVHQNSAAGEADSGWQEVVLNPARKIDLLELTNGVLEELGQTTLPAGTYTQMRLVLAQNTAAPWANSVVPEGGSEEKLDTPSGQQSGLKMNVNITVEPGQTADMVIDFDACKSIVKAGNSGKYNLKPVLSVIPRLSGTIVGYVATTLASAGANVSVQNTTGDVIKATPPDATTGQFVLFPVPVGTYNLVVTAPGYVTGVITGVPVATTTNVGSNSVPIALDSTSSRNAAGTVSVGGSVIDTDASVRVLQTLATPTSITVEVAGKPVDADTGGFTFPLPIGAPVRTTYADFSAYVANTSLPIPFTSDAAAAAKYTLEAEAPGPVIDTEEIDLTNTDSNTPFTF